MPSNGLVAFSAPLGCEGSVCSETEVGESSYAKLDGNGKEVAASGLGNGFTTGNTRQVNVAGLNETLLALDGSQDLLGEASAWSAGSNRVAQMETYRKPA